MDIYVYYIITIRKNGMVARPSKAIVPCLMPIDFFAPEAITKTNRDPKQRPSNQMDISTTNPRLPSLFFVGRTHC